MAALVSATRYAQISRQQALLSPQSRGYMQRAGEFTDQGLYEAVADQLQRIQTENLPLTDTQRREFLFMLGNAYSRTGNPQCLNLLNEFIERYPGSSEATEARLSKADFLFFSHQYVDALAAYNTIDFSRITPSLLPEATYHKAFCLVKCGFFEEARPLLRNLADNPEYSKAALFTDAYADYMTGRLNEAYKKFKRLQQTAGVDPSLDPDYYIAQILYARGDYNQAARIARRLINEGIDNELASETTRLYGMATFKNGDTARAYPSLKKYVEEEGENAAPDAIYALASILYDRDETADAALLFSRLTDINDAIGQGALLAMGQICAGNGDDNAAAIYFEKASRLGFDSNVSRRALYNYVAARTRGGRIPFAPQIDLLQRFVNEYPESDKTPAVREYLASAYFQEKDYYGALQSIEGITNPSKATRIAHQKILYELGVQCLQNDEPSKAATYLKEAVALGNLDGKLLPEATLWLGDALYAGNRYSEAAAAYAKAVPSLKGLNRALALYGEAYSRFQNQEYSKAGKLFATCAQDKSLPDRLRSDSRIRNADCMFYSGDNEGARRLYSSLSSEGLTDSDYSAWRHAELTGVAGDMAGKIRELETLRSKASSRWMPEILSSLAEAYASTGKHSKAEEILTELVEDYPDSRTAPRAALVLADSYAESGDRDKAATAYLEIMERWPSSAQASTADKAFRRILAAEGRLDEYAEATASLGGNFSLDIEEMEALSFEAAADAYNDSQQTDLLQEYLAKFPDGDHSTEALYMLANGLESAGKNKDAYAAWQRLEGRGDQQFTHEAYAGLMRTAPDADSRLKYARMVAEQPGVSAEEASEARLVEAEALALSGKGSEAEKIWSELATRPSTLSGAKAAVALGEYLLKQKKASKAESVLTSLIDSGTPHTYWLARGYIALADAYIAQGKQYIARQYLESLRDNYPGKESDIRKMINSRLSGL